jgi:hypothetical protein
MPRWSRRKRTRPCSVCSGGLEARKVVGNDITFNCRTLIINNQLAHEERRQAKCVTLFLSQSYWHFLLLHSGTHAPATNFRRSNRQTNFNSSAKGDRDELGIYRQRRDHTATTNLLNLRAAQTGEVLSRARAPVRIMT